MVGMARGVSRCVSVTMVLGVTQWMAAAPVLLAGEVNIARSGYAPNLNCTVPTVVSSVDVISTILTCKFALLSMTKS